MDTSTLAEHALESTLEKYERSKVVTETGSDGKIPFRKSFSFGKRKCVSMDYSVNITDDSGFIPFEKEIERFNLSGKNYEQFMRMAFPNGSADKVANDYISPSVMSRLDAINYVNDKSIELQDRLFQRACDNDARAKDNQPVKVEVVNVNQPTAPQEPKA